MNPQKFITGFSKTPSDMLSELKKEGFLAEYRKMPERDEYKIVLPGGEMLYVPGRTIADMYTDFLPALRGTGETERVEIKPV